MDLNQIERQKEQTAPEGTIEQERQQVRAAERARTKQLERQHRGCLASFDDEETRQCGHADNERDDDRRMRPSFQRRLDHAVHDAAESQRHE